MTEYGSEPNWLNAGTHKVLRIATKQSKRTMKDFLVVTTSENGKAVEHLSFSKRVVRPIWQNIDQIEKLAYTKYPDRLTLPYDDGMNARNFDFDAPVEMQIIERVSENDPNIKWLQIHRLTIGDTVYRFQQEFDIRTRTSTDNWSMVIAKNDTTRLRASVTA